MPDSESINLEYDFRTDDLLKGKQIPKFYSDFFNRAFRDEVYPYMVHKTLDGLMLPDQGVPIEVGIVNVTTQSHGSRAEKILRCILSSLSFSRPHIVIAPEYSFLPASGPMPEDEKEEYLETFRKASETGVMIIPGTFVWQKDKRMYNTAYVFHDGKVVFEHDKNCDAGERGIADNYGLVYMPGNWPGAFNWGDLKLGIEICADAGLLKDNGFRDRDILFLVSCGCSGIGNSLGAVRQYGYGVVADGAQQVCDVEQQLLEPEALLELSSRGPYKGRPMNEWLSRIKGIDGIGKFTSYSNFDLAERA